MILVRSEVLAAYYKPVINWYLSDRVRSFRRDCELGEEAYLFESWMATRGYRQESS